MVSEREQNREWLEREAGRDALGWEAGYIASFGIEGALDLLALQSGRVHEVNLTHRPFSSNPGLKVLVLELRIAQMNAATAAYTIAFRMLDQWKEDHPRD